MSRGTPNVESNKIRILSCVYHECVSFVYRHHFQLAVLRLTKCSQKAINMP